MWSLRLLYFIMFIRYSNFGRFFTLFLLLQGLSNSQIGTILSVALLSRTISTFILSAISDSKKYHNYKVLIIQIAIFLSGITSLLYLLPPYWLQYELNNIQLFFYFLITTIIFYLFTWSEYPLIIALTMIKLSEKNNKIKYGIYRSYGAISWGIMHLFIGLCLQFNIITLTYLMFFYAITIPFNLIIIYLAFGQESIEQTVDKDYGTINIKECNKASKWTTLLYILNTPSILSTVFLIFCVGGGRNVLESFLFIYIYTQYSNSLFLYGLLGLSVLITVTFEFPLFIFEKSLVKYFGFRLMIIFGSIFLIIRFVGYTLLNDNTLIYGFLLIEFLHGLSYALIDMSLVTICSDLFPYNMQTIAQGLLSIIKSGVAPFIFVLISGVIFDKFGGVLLFRCMAVTESIALILFIILTTHNKLNSQTEMQLANGEL